MTSINNFLVLGLLEFQESIAACIIQKAYRNLDICGICLEKVCKSDDNCHNFHNTCIKKWIISGPTTCPVCRSHLKCSLPTNKQFFMNTASTLIKLQLKINKINPAYFKNQEIKRTFNRRMQLCNWYIDTIPKIVSGQFTNLTIYIKKIPWVINILKEFIIELEKNILKKYTEYQCNFCSLLLSSMISLISSEG